MKKKTLALLFPFFLWAAPGFAQTPQDEQALTDFRFVVNRFVEFFKTTPKIVSKRRDPTTTTGLVFNIREYSLVDSSYDIERTNSLVSPFIGSLNMTVTARDNDSCGDVRNKYGAYGWATIEETVSNDQDKCFKWHKNEWVNATPTLVYIERSAPHVLTFVFAYQDKKWTLKDVTTGGGSMEFILAVFSRPTKSFPEITESEALRYNKKWADLIKSIETTTK